MGAIMMTRPVVFGTAGPINSPASESAITSPGNPPRMWAMLSSANRYSTPVEVMAAPMMSAATTKTQFALAKPVRATTGVVMPNTTQALAIKSASTPSSSASSASAGNPATNTISACHATADSPGGGGSIQPSAKMTIAATRANPPRPSRHRVRASATVPAPACAGA
jgi:hypothetical protein